MKKLSMLAIVMFFIAGCAVGQIQVDQNSQEVIARIIGWNVGYELEKQYPEVSHEVLALSKAIRIEKEPGVIRILLDRLVALLSVEVDNLLLAVDLEDAVVLIKIDPDLEITDEQMQIIQATAEGLISGIETFQQRNINIKIGE